MTTRTALAFVFIIIGFTLAGCGLSPVYGTYAGSNSASVNTALNTVYIENIPERSGQKLRNLLTDRFYQSGAPRAGGAAYHLRVSGISESIYGLGIAKDATATRSQLRLFAGISLVPANDLNGKPVLQRNISAISSFNTLASQYTTLVSEEDARDQTIKDLAQQITSLLELYFANPAAYAAQEPEAPAAMSEAERVRRDPRRAIGDY